MGEIKRESPEISAGQLSLFEARSIGNDCWSYKYQQVGGAGLDSLMFEKIAQNWNGAEEKDLLFVLNLTLFEKSTQCRRFAVLDRDFCPN